MEPYKAPVLLFGSHLETMYPSLFRKVVGITYIRERITTPDHDFLDLDWLRQGSKKLVIISHGLEGNSDRAYVRGMARIFFNHGFDVLAWNYRGCSGEMNRKIRFYHSGATDDLDFTIRHAASLGYDEINLVGFSLGGNLTLKYLGEKGDALLVPTYCRSPNAGSFSKPRGLSPLFLLRSSIHAVTTPGVGSAHPAAQAWRPKITEQAAPDRFAHRFLASVASQGEDSDPSRD